MVFRKSKGLFTSSDGKEIIILSLIFGFSLFESFYQVLFSNAISEDETKNSKDQIKRLKL